MSSDPLRAARRARWRLSAAGWLLVGAGGLIAVAADVLAPFFSPFGLAAGALTALAGFEFVRYRTPIVAVLGGAAALFSGAGAGLATAAGNQAGAFGGALAAALIVLGASVLAILFADAGHLPSGPTVQ